MTSKNKFSPEIDDGDLILAEDEAEINLTRIKQEEQETIRKYSAEGGISGGGISPIIFIISKFLMVVSILVKSGMAGPLLGMINVFKMVYSLRLINVFFGNILEAFL